MIKVNIQDVIRLEKKIKNKNLLIQVIKFIKDKNN